MFLPIAINWYYSFIVPNPILYIKKEKNSKKINVQTGFSLFFILYALVIALTR